MAGRYQEFLCRTSELADLDHAQALLGWDQETYMPQRGTDLRARSQGTLAGIAHERLTDPRLVKLVAELRAEELGSDALANVEEIDRQQRRALRIPRELVVELRLTESLSHQAWVVARRERDFATYAPWLSKVLNLKLEVANRVGYEGSIYNAFLDLYEPFARVEEIGPLFDKLRQQLVPMVEAIAKCNQGPSPLQGREFPVKRQEIFGRRIIQDMGFDLEAGRLDVAVHPFCQGLSPDDVRLTTRYNTDNLQESLFGTIHEAGHGLYEQGLPADAKGTPLCQSISLGIHESQSRLWENMVARSRSFWRYYLPVLQAEFPRELHGIDLDGFYGAVNRVEPSFIRVEADEITYNLHILLRYELEILLVEGAIAIDELPAAWGDRMNKYLGIRPENDAQGVLQDVHWSLGLLGYFPTYTLGNLYAAQFFDRAIHDVPGLLDGVMQGDLKPLRIWLKENIHQRGRRLSAAGLVEEVTGSPLDADHFVRYLKNKFGPLYGIG